MEESTANFSYNQVFVLFSKILFVSLRVRVMVFNATCNNISVISWWSVLLVEETGVPGETTDLSQIT